MLKRRTSKRFILAESGEDVTWDPKTDTTNADQTVPTASAQIPTITEPDVLQGTSEKTETTATQVQPTTSLQQQQQQNNLLKVNTGGLTLKYVFLLMILS